MSDVFLEDLCFGAQQAAEKAIKAVLIHLIVAQSGISIAESVREAGRLTRFASVTRYPGLAEPVTQEEYEQAVVIAEIVFQWANDIVGRQP